jgi:hypothetical protein
MPRLIEITNIKFTPHPSKKGKNVWKVTYNGKAYKFLKTQKDANPHSFEPEPTPKAKENIIAAFRFNALNFK